MIRTYCKITGYELVRGEGFDGFKGMKLAPTIHPIFTKSRGELLEILRANYVKPEQQVERVLLTVAMLKSLDVIRFKSPLLIDSIDCVNSSNINAAFAATCSAFRTISNMLDGDSTDRELCKELPVYNVTMENFEDAALFRNYCVRLAELSTFKFDTKRNNEYDVEDDSLNLRLAILGVEKFGLEENDRLPKRFTPLIAEWAVDHYCKAQGEQPTGTRAKIAYKLLTSGIDERSNGTALESLRDILAAILPTPTEYTADKAKTVLTLRHLDNKITEHAELMNAILGVPTEIQSAGAGDISWTVVKTTKEKATSKPSKPEPVRVQDTNQKKKVSALLKRFKRG